MKSGKGISEELKIPEGVSVKIIQGVITVIGKKGETTKKMYHKKIEIVKKEDTLILKSSEENKKIKKMIGTYKAHLKNMFKGSQEGHKYILKICSGHFPMNVSVSKNNFIIKNLLGEKIPRVMKIKSNVSVSVDGDFVTVESADKEFAGQCASSIEQLTKRSNYDTRVFQDGIYIINKDSKELK